MTVPAPTFEFFATCPLGAEALLAAELKALGCKRVRPLKGGAAFFGEAATALRTCLWSRLAGNVTVVLGRVAAAGADQLYSGVRALDWGAALRKGATVAVSAKGTNGQLRNSQFTALKVKDALCDALSQGAGWRPDVNPQAPDAAIEVRLRDEKAVVSLNLSGASLHRRGYLDEADGAHAPRAIGQAAAQLVLADWPRLYQEGCGFLDPSCNEGLLLVEAALAAFDGAPGISRSSWGFFGWAAFSQDVWDALLAEADDRFEKGLQEAEGLLRLLGLSASSPSIARGRMHARRAGLGCNVSVELVEEGRQQTFQRQLAKTGSDGRLLVAWARPSDHSVEDARARAEESAFVEACRMAPPSSVFVSAAENALDQPFGGAPDAREALKAGDQQAVLAVRTAAPAALESIRVPSPHGDGERTVAVYDKGAAQFASRLAKMARQRRKWAKREKVSCYRVYDRDLPEYSCSVDVYEGAGESAGKTYCMVAEYQAPKTIDAVVARQRFSDVLAIVPAVLGLRPDHVFSKVRSHGKGGSQYADGGQRSYVAFTAEETFLPPAAPLATAVAKQGLRLNGLQSRAEERGIFRVDFTSYLDTGLFLDHRLTRQLVGAMARGTCFLNLFAYTGAATVHAVLGGAATTTTVDLSQTYLDWAAENLRLNGAEPAFAERKPQRGPGARGKEASPHRLVRADVLAWITQARRERQIFDLIFVDPPTFSNSKAMGQRSWDVQRDHVELLIGVSRLLAKGGVAVFSCNLKSFKPAVEELARYGVQLEDITALTIPADFERTPKVHHCYLVRRSAVRAD